MHKRYSFIQDYKLFLFKWKLILLLRKNTHIHTYLQKERKVHCFIWKKRIRKTFNFKHEFLLMLSNEIGLVKITSFNSYSYDIWVSERENEYPWNIKILIILSQVFSFFMLNLTETEKERDISAYVGMRIF